MRLDRVTITGADNSVRPLDLARLTDTHPFVEWGILVSRSQTDANGPRWPSRAWISDLQALKIQRAGTDEHPIKLALHVCGRWVRELLMGENAVPLDLLEAFDRVQLNFHADGSPANYRLLREALPSLGERQIIFQIDGAMGKRHLQEMWRLDPEGELDLVPLFDVSHGRGVLPESWPSPIAPGVYHGYAGGLGPVGLTAQLDHIDRAAGSSRVWVDMETNVRSHDDRTFDLEKVRLVLEAAQHHIAAPAAT